MRYFFCHPPLKLTLASVAHGTPFNFFRVLLTNPGSLDANKIIEIFGRVTAGRKLNNNSDIDIQLYYLFLPSNRAASSD